MLTVHVMNGRAFVWNADDVFTLRTEYRIVGNLVGCLPRQPYQILENGLPLQLLPEEATLLAEKGFIELVSNSNLCKIPSSEDVEKFMERREDLFQQQVELYLEERKKTILSMADIIIEGKRKKTLDKLRGISPKKKKKTKGMESSSAREHMKEIEDESSRNQTAKKSDSEDPPRTKGKESSPTSVQMTESVDKSDPCSSDKVDTEEKESTNLSVIDDPSLSRDAILEEELKKVSTVPKETCMVQIFTEFPFKSVSSNVAADWRFPLSDEDVLRYAIFKDLWEKGHYLTSGTKFGGDFLVYAGDPVKFHALYVVVCVPYSKHFQAIDLVLLGRLGTQVKKSVVLATVTPQNNVDYISLRWMGD